MGGAAPGGRRRRAAVALAAGAALFAAVLVQGRIEARAASRPSASPLMYLPSGRYLRVASLGFHELLADLIYLWSIQYYGNYAIADRYRYLDQIYRQVITELDPRYLDPYLIGSLIMTFEARRPDLALRLLDKGIEKLPGAWILPFEAGFTCYDVLRDYARAAAYFERAMAVPGAPPAVRRWYAEMHNRAGDKRTSLREWAAIHAGAEDDMVRGIAWNHVHDLTVEVHLTDLHDAIARHRERHGAPPRRLQDLVAAGLLAAVPSDPEGRDYRYNPATGQASYQGSLILSR